MPSFPFMLRNLLCFPSPPPPRQLLLSLSVLMQTLEPCIQAEFDQIQLLAINMPLLYSCTTQLCLKFLQNMCHFPAGKENKPQSKQHTTLLFPPSLHFYSCNNKRLLTGSITHDSNQADITSEYNREHNELQGVWQGAFQMWGI